MNRYHKILSIALLMIFFGFINNKSTEAEEKFDDISVEKYNLNVSKLKKISANNLVEKNNNKESYILYIGRADCYYCRSYSENIKLLNEQLLNNLYYYDLDTGDMTEELLELFVNTWDISVTPTFVSVVRGNLQNKYEGADLAVDDLYLLLTSDESSSSESSSSESSSSESGSSESGSSESGSSESGSSESGSSESSSSESSSSESGSSESSSSESSSSESSSSESGSSESDENTTKLAGKTTLVKSKLPETGEINPPCLDMLGIITLVTVMCILKKHIKNIHT